MGKRTRKDRDRLKEELAVTRMLLVIARDRMLALSECLAARIAEMEKVANESPRS